jgi:protein DEK
LEEEAKRSRRPRPRKKSLDGEGGEFVNTPKRARSSAEKKEAISFAADRPTRDRKSIDRFIASAQKENTRELRIKQGGGTLLKDIPNVVFEVSKRYKHDEALGQLHLVLFNKRGKAAVIKQHILQFSGFVWGDNQEKERAKVQEKLERYTKDSLVQFVDVLNLHVSRNLKKVLCVVSLKSI